MRKADLFFISYLVAIASPAQQISSFINFETPPVHPVSLSPDGQTLAVCNLPDNRVELFDVASALPRSLGEVAVGLDPVSVRWRTTNELWVANHISRTVSIIDVSRRLVVTTLSTLDGPADVLFAGSPSRAFISCAKENTLQVFDPMTRQLIRNLTIDGERPKAMAASPDGTKVYVAIFESGNGSTILVGAGTNNTSVLKHPDGPYGGQFPPPNDGSGFRPPLNSSLYGTEDRMPDSLIVKKNAADRWMDDNHGDWTEFVSGRYAELSGRVAGWDLPDQDLAIIDTSTFAITYATGLMNLCMDVAVNPASGRVSVIGTDGTNERRFEPNLRGTFLRVNLAWVEPGGVTKSVVDLNPHLDYSASSVPQSVRAQSIGDPRGIVWNSQGTRGYVTGMGSRNLVVIDGQGSRVGSAPLELPEGPSGIVLDEARQRLYVLNRFSASLSMVDIASLSVITNVALPDPTPAVIKTGRKHLYDTRRNSGLGQASCASCHPDARFDRLAWDLGDPRGEMSEAPGSGLPFHPMKGPMATITLQDIIVPAEFTALMPLHWRGDRRDIESFNITFTDLLARDSQLSTNEMQELKAFLSTIHVPPSRYRNLDDSMPTNVPLPGFYGVNATGVPDRTPLPNGNAIAGRDRFFNDTFNGRFSLTIGSCTTCHNYASGRGLEGDFLHVEREPNRFFRPSQLRSISEKLGMDRLSTNSRSGFGFRFDGRSDTLTSLFSDVFQVTNNQVIADMTAFLLSVPGGGISVDSYRNDNQAVHAAVGRQVTVTTPEGPPLLTEFLQLGGLEGASNFDVIVHGLKDGIQRSWYLTGGMFQSDRNVELHSLSNLLALTAEAPLTFMAVPAGTGRRMGVDRDEDGIFDQTELETGYDPTDPNSHPSNHSPQFDPMPSFPLTHPGFTLEATLTARDVDAPPQDLAFSLEPGAPSGATLDPVTGKFVWTPTLEQADRFYQIRVRVTDTGQPPLVDVQTIGVSVQKLQVLWLRLDAASGSNTVYIYCSGSFGHVYQLQYKERLEDPIWTEVEDPVLSFGNPVALMDRTPAAVARRFYRVRIVE
jgi:DNA-binding beta-propeller fold protein YncE